MPTVSVVIPSYRGGPYLRESVDSVRAQTFGDWEIIVVADGCEEDFSDIEEKDRRIRVFRQRNRGESIARNIGIGLAESELIALLDDDDRMLPDRLRAQREAMKDESVSLCHTQCQVINSDGVVIGAGISRESQYLDFLRTDGRIVISSTMLRKSVLQAVGGFNPLLPIGADLDLLYRVAREGKVRFLPEVLTEYRVHGNNIWFNSSSSAGEEIRLILTQHRLVAQARGETETLEAIRQGSKYVLPGRAQFALQRADDARSRHDYRGAAFSFAQAMAIAPSAVPRVVARALRRDRQQRKTSG
jgi:glycosyltransferase involved in cell wall biosynthesis